MDNKLLNRLEEVIRTDATITNAEDFLATHMPFKNLKYYNSGEPIDITREYKEDEFFREFMLDNNDKHSFIVVEGNSGAGKSHFIRWIKYKYENETDINNEVCILIERSHNTLQGAIKQISEAAAVRDLLDKNEIQKLAEVNSNLSSEKLTYTITNAFITEIQSEDDEDSLLRKSQRKTLAAFLQDPIIQERILFKEDGPIERIKSKLSSSNTKSVKEIDVTFNEEDFNFGFDSEIMREMTNSEDRSAENAIKCAQNLIENRKNFKSLMIQYLNSKIDIVIQSRIKLSFEDFTQIFIKLRKGLRKQNKNLTLFIEDLTSFTGIDKALVEALIVDHNGDKSICRLFSVVGITISYYNSHFPDNLKARVTGRIVIDDKSIISEEKDILDMSARYLNAIYLDNIVLKSWLNSGAVEEDLPISDKYNNHKWSIYVDAKGNEFSLFPFNKNALINLYATLEYKTPRSFLKEVIKKVFADYIKLPENFPHSEKEFQGYFKVPAWREPLHQQIIMKQADGYDAERLSCFLRVWGDKTAYKTINEGKEYLGSVAKDAYDFFKIPFVDGIPTEKAAVVKHSKKNDEGNIKVIKEYVKDKTEVIPIKDEGMHVGRQPKTEKAEVDKKRQIFDKKMEEITYWYKEDEVFTDHIKYRDDSARIIKDIIDWDVEELSPLIVEAFLTKSRIHIRGQKVQVDKGFVLERTEENYYFLQAITAWRYLGESSWGFEHSLGYLSNITNWIIKNKKEIINLMKIGEKLEEDNFDIEKWDMLKWGIYNEYVLNVINGNILLESKSDIMKIYLAIFNKKFNIDLIKTRRLGKLAPTIENKKEDLRQNHEFVIRYHNCILGEAKSETTTSFYLDAYELINNIRELKEINWNINNLYIPTLKESTTKWYITCNVINGVWKNKLDIALTENISKISNMINNIKEIVQYTDHNEDQENINELFIQFKNFLTKKMQSVNESYDDKFQVIVNDEINGEFVLQEIHEFNNINKDDIIEKLIYVVSQNIITVGELNNLLADVQSYVNDKYDKFMKRTSELRTVDEEFITTKDTFDSYINEIEKSLLEMHGGDNSATDR